MKPRILFFDCLLAAGAAEATTEYVTPATGFPELVVRPNAGQAPR